MEENNNNSIWKMALAAFGLSYLAKKLEKSLENTYTPTLPIPKPIKNTSPFGIIKTTHGRFIVTGEPETFKGLRNPADDFEGRAVYIPNHDCVPQDYSVKYTETIIRKRYNIHIEKKLLNRFIMCDVFKSGQPLDKALLYASTILKDKRIYEVGKMDHIKTLNIRGLGLNLLISSIPIDFIIAYMDEFSKKDTLAVHELWDLPLNIVKNYEESINNESLLC